MHTNREDNEEENTNGMILVAFWAPGWMQWMKDQNAFHKALDE